MAKRESIKKSDIFVLTGELSGDLLGYSLLKDLAKNHTIEGVIGPNLKKLGIKEILPMDSFNFMGLSKPISSIFKILSSLKAVYKHILATNPKVLLLIDLPDINLRVAKKVRQKGYKGKIIQVVCPTIWAWRPKRKAILEKYYDQLLCLFPFEKDLFKDSTLKVSYIGHPLNSIVPREDEPTKKIIAIFPGSRKQEVQSLLPSFLKACENFPEYEIHVSIAKDSLRHSIVELTKGQNVILRDPKDKDTLIKEASFALAKNGTINLELALSFVPQVSCYTVSRLEKFIYTTFFSLFLPHYSLPNILLQKRAIPELIGPVASQKNISTEFTNLVRSPYLAASMKADYKNLSSFLKDTDSQVGSSLVSKEL